MLAILAPGQGAQTPGFLAPWLGDPVAAPGVAERLRWWSAVTGIDLVAAGTSWEAEQIRDTAVAQPLLVAAGIAAATAVFDIDVHGDPHGGARGLVGVAAGHSVGEFTAAALAGALSAESALALVRERGRTMAAASALEPTGMSAVLGGDTETVLAAIESLDLTAANHNGGGQVVAAGRLENLEKLASEAPGGARVRPLSVAGAFHTRFMAPAVEALAALAAGVPTRDPRVRLLSNADGAVVASGRAFLDRLVAQVASPVRWDECMRTLGELGVTAVIELPPAGTLAGLVRRSLPGVETLTLKTPDDIPAARTLIAAHSDQSAEPMVAWRIVVAPVGGMFAPAPLEAGDRIRSGGTIGTVTARGREESVTAVHAGLLVEWLAEDGDPVSPGQPVARLHPEGAIA